MSHTSPAPQHRLADLRDWLMDQIDGSIETRGDDGLISDFIRQIDALSETVATVEPRGCPTPGSCSAVAELADLKQRLLPQYLGRAQRAEHERDALLEQLIAARSSMQQAYGCLWRYVGASNPMFLQARKMLLAQLTREQQASGIRYANEVFGYTTEHEILHSDCPHDAAPSATAAPVAWMYEESGERMFGHPDGYRPKDAVPLYAGSPPVEEEAIGHALNTLGIIANWGDEENEWDAVVKYRSVRDRAATHVAILRSDWAQQLPGAEIFDRAARYEYIRTLNPRQFAALFDEALHGDRFDALVDRYRMKGEKP